MEKIKKLILATITFILTLLVGIGLGYLIFQKGEGEKRTVELFYYNPTIDIDETGNILCSKKGLVPLHRTITAKEDKLIEETVNLLIKGQLRPEEKALGITTEYPLSGFALVSSNLSDGVLTLTFKDPKNRTAGGACRVGVLWFQIEATAKQFAKVKEVRFLPEELFQP